MTNSNLSNQAGKSSKIWKPIFMVFILIQGVFQLVFGLLFIFDLPSAIAVFNTPYSPDIEVLGLAFGIYLLLSSSLHVLSFIWIRKSNQAGVVLAIIIGIGFISIGVGMEIKFGETQTLLFDGLRGVLTVFLAYMAGRGIKQQ